MWFHDQMLFLFWYWDLILILREFIFSAAVRKRYEYTQEVVPKTIESNLQNAPLQVRRSKKNPQRNEEERCEGDTELDSLEKETKKWKIIVPAGIYLLKVNNRNTRTRCEICSSVSIVNF